MGQVWNRKPNFLSCHCEPVKQVWQPTVSGNQESLIASLTFAMTNNRNLLGVSLPVGCHEASPLAMTKWQILNEVSYRHCEQVRNGDVRFLIGSTKKMGAGMNVQDRVVGLHHIDAAWNPADLEQRDGRGIRQGNIFMKDNPDFKLKVFYYLTKNSTDAIYYAKLEQKQASIRNFRSGHAIERNVDEQIELDYAEFAAAISGDKREIIKAQWQRELAELEAEKRGLSGRASNETKEKEMLLAATKELPKTIEQLKADIEIAKQRGKRELSEAEIENLKSVEIEPSNSEPLFVLDNYEVFLEHNNIGNSYRLCAVSENGHEILLRGWQQNMIQSVAHYARELLKATTEESLEKQLGAKTIELAKKQERLKALQDSDFSQRLDELENAIAKTKENLDKLAKGMAENAAESEGATTNLASPQQKLLQRELAEFGALIKDDSIINPQKVEITDLESLATFLNGWRNVDEPISAKDLLDPKRLREMLLEINHENTRKLLDDLRSIALSVDPRIDKDKTWRMLKEVAHEYQNDRELIAKSKRLQNNYSKWLEELQKYRTKLEQDLHINPIQDFGTNYAEFYHDGAGAIQKLIAEAKDYQARKTAKQLTKEEQEIGAFKGQVAGAFYREELGNITLAWGEEGTGKSDGYGLAKIAKFHPEVLDKLDEIITSLPIIKKTNNRFQLEDERYKIGIRRDFEGVKQNWVLTAFEKKDSIARRRTDLPSAETEAGKTTPANASTDSTPPNIKSGLENADIDKTAHELKRVEQEIAANKEKLDKSELEERQRLREAYKELVQKKRAIKAELANKAIESLQNRKAERSEAMNVNLELIESVGIEGLLKVIKKPDQQKAVRALYDSIMQRPDVEYISKDGSTTKIKKMLGSSSQVTTKGHVSTTEKDVYLAFDMHENAPTNVRTIDDIAILQKELKEAKEIHTSNNGKTINSNMHAGSGIATGSIAGIETDEQGNISFSPEKFALGFLAGAGGSKILSSPKLREQAIKAVQGIQEDYGALSKENPQLFATILHKMQASDLTKPKAAIERKSREVFNKELQAKIEEAIAKGRVETMPASPFKNIEEFGGMFDSIEGNRGIIKTPYKDVKINLRYAYYHFQKNTNNTNREHIKGGFFSAFREPLFVVSHVRKDSEKPSVYFYKPFYDDNKKIMNLFGIGIDEKGHVDFRTYYLDGGNRLDSILSDRNLKILYVH